MLVKWGLMATLDGPMQLLCGAREQLRGLALLAGVRAADNRGRQGSMLCRARPLRVTPYLANRKIIQFLIDRRIARAGRFGGTIEDPCRTHLFKRRQDRIAAHPNGIFSQGGQDSPVGTIGP
jgi:hypothetical protein